MPPRRGSLKRGYYSSSTCLRRFSDPPHTAKRDTFLLLGEHALLARLLARLPRPSPTVLVGPGDDAAVVAGSRNERLVVTTDAVVEGVHFSRAYSTPADIGHRALAVNLSDLAAMGATPRWALLSLMLPSSIREADIEELDLRIRAILRRSGTSQEQVCHVRAADEQYERGHPEQERERAAGLGGSIEIDGRPGAGTRVVLRVPVAGGSPAPPRL